MDRFRSGLDETLAELGRISPEAKRLQPESGTCTGRIVSNFGRRLVDLDGHFVEIR